MARLIKVMLILSLVLVTLVTDVVEARSRVTKWLSSKGKRTVYIPTADGRVLKFKGNKCKIKNHAPVISKTPVNINPDEEKAGKEGGDEAGGADDQEAGDAGGGEEPRELNMPTRRPLSLAQFWTENSMMVPGSKSSEKETRF